MTITTGTEKAKKVTLTHIPNWSATPTFVAGPRTCSSILTLSEAGLMPALSKNYLRLLSNKHDVRSATQPNKTL